jgi:mRNA-degrading endonuclease RelE of RelBE toxin-antitoxin system
MRLRILLHRRAYDFLKGLRSEDRQRLIDKLRQLEDFPSVRLDVVKVAGEADTFKLRVGNYRASRFMSRRE